MHIYLIASRDHLMVCGDYLGSGSVLTAARRSVTAATRSWTQRMGIREIQIRYKPVPTAGVTFVKLAAVC